MSRKPQLLSAVATLKGKGNNGIPHVGRVALTDKTLYLNVSVKGHGGTIQLIDVNTKREVGVTNIDGNKLNAGRDYIIDGMRILKGSLSVANVKADKYITTGLLPEALQNAEIRLKQGGNVLIDQPVSDLFNGSANELFRNISTSPLIVSNQEFEFEIEYPRGLSVPTDSEYNIRIEFRAHQAKV